MLGALASGKKMNGVVSGLHEEMAAVARPGEPELLKRPDASLIGNLT